MKLIIIEGNIGVGKSTLTQKLANSLNAKAYYESVEDNPYLELYYRDRAKYALSLQFYMMSQRYKQHLEAIQHCWITHQTCIFDRSIYGDHVFTKQNYLDSCVSELDYKNYLNMKDHVCNNLLPPHLAIYLKNDPDVSYRNIQERGRDCEKAIELSYLKALHERHSELMQELSAMGSNIIEIDWNDFKPLSYVLEKIKDYV